MGTSVNSMEQNNQAHIVGSAPDPSSGQTASAPSTRLATLYQIWLHVIWPLLFTRILLVVIGVVTNYYILPLIDLQQPMYVNAHFPGFPAMLLKMWNHFDSGFYINLAINGYGGPSALQGQTTWGFFPLYSLLLRICALPFGSNPGPYVYDVIGIVLSNIATVVAGIYLYKLTSRELNGRAAARVVFYLLLFPMSFYLSAIYPESLFLALSVGCIYYARLQKWGIAGVLGGLATLTRSEGVILILGVGWEYWQYLANEFASLEPVPGVASKVGDWVRSHLSGLWRSLAHWGTWLDFLKIALIPGALLLFLAYAQWKTGTYLAYVIAQKVGWGHTASNPILLVIHALHHPEAASPYDWNFYSLNIIAILVFAGLLIPIFRKLPAVYGILSTAFILMPLTTGEINSAARYYLTIFPVFIFLAWWSTRGDEVQQMRRHTFIVVLFALLLSLGMVLFTMGVFSIV